MPVRAEESVKLKTQNFEPTLRSESREYLHSLPSREEEKPPLWWVKNRRGDKFSGSPLAVGKTDAYAFLLREKVSVF